MPRISLISDSRKKILIWLLEDPAYNSEILLDGDIPKTIEVQDDGSVLIGRTSKGWINYFFPKDKRVIEFPMIAFRIAENLTKIARPGTQLDKYLAKEILAKAIRSRQYDKVVDMLLHVAMFGVTEGTLKSNYITDEDVKKAQYRQASQEHAGKTKDGIPVHVVLPSGCGSFPVGSLFVDHD